MEFDYKILEEKFNQLPGEIQLALTSASVSSDIEAIGKKNGLLVDQIGILFDITSYVLLGLIPTRDFISTLSKEAKLDKKTAATIASDINEKVMTKIKNEIQKVQNNEEQSQNESSAEIGTAGGFEIEKSINDEETNSVTADDRADILSELENPEASRERVEKREDTEFKEPLVDALLEQGTMAPKKPAMESDHLAKTTPPPNNLPTGGARNVFEVKKEIPKAPTPPVPPKKTGPDPYREPVE